MTLANWCTGARRDDPETGSSVLRMAVQWTQTATVRKQTDAANSWSLKNGSCKARRR